MKKKILALCLVVALMATAIAGATLAYFSDTDAQTNTFTTGNVDIDLWEDFGDNDSTGIEELHPVTYNPDGTRKDDNCVEKEVYITNDGSEDAYVRVHIAIPTILDDGNPDFDASANILHFNADKGTYADGAWNWAATKAGNDNLTGNAMVSGNDWNFYTTSIYGKDYNVYVVTYETKLAKDETTPDAISQVYLDKEVTNEDITGIKNVLGDKWMIYVAAEGTQAEGFADAYEALNTAFGNPTDSTYTSTIDWTTVSNRTWLDTDYVG